MFGFNRWNTLGDLFHFQRDMDQLFDRLWNELPARTAGAPANSFQVNRMDDGWRIDFPLPGIDPERVALEASGNTVTIRVEEPRDEKKGERVTPFEQTLTLPQFLDVDKVSASHRHGMLHLMVPLKEGLKPRRIPIETKADEGKRLTTDERRELAGARA